MSWQQYSLCMLKRFWQNLKPWFLRFGSTGSGTSVLAPTSQYQGFGFNAFRGLFAFLSFWYWFGSISVPFWLQIRLWYWNLTWLEPKLFKFWASEYRSCGCFGILGFRPKLLDSHDSFKITYETDISHTTNPIYVGGWNFQQIQIYSSLPNPDPFNTNCYTIVIIFAFGSSLN